MSPFELLVDSRLEGARSKVTADSYDMTGVLMHSTNLD